MLFSILLNFTIGLVAHITMYPVLERNYSPRIARLGAYIIGEIIDFTGSWFIMVAYGRSHHDRRVNPIAFERYMLVRFLAAAALGLGVVLGYALDEED